MQQHAKPSLTSEILIVQSMNLRGKKKKYKGKNSVNPSQTSEIIIVQSMELRERRRDTRVSIMLTLGWEMY